VDKPVEKAGSMALESGLDSLCHMPIRHWRFGIFWRFINRKKARNSVARRLWISG